LGTDQWEICYGTPLSVSGAAQPGLPVAGQLSRADTLACQTGPACAVELEGVRLRHGIPT
jgi:hypothetical protein